MENRTFKYEPTERERIDTGLQSAAGEVGKQAISTRDVMRLIFAVGGLLSLIDTPGDPYTMKDERQVDELRSAFDALGLVDSDNNSI